MNGKTISPRERQIPFKQEIAISAIVNKHRALMGWTILSPREMNPVVVAWAEVFDRHRIPFKHYNELYLRAVDLRRMRLQEGLNCPEFSAELLISCWSGLAYKLRQEEIADGRSLTEHAESQCPKCFGSNWEIVPGKGARPCPNCRPEAFENFMANIRR